MISSFSRLANPIDNFFRNIKQVKWIKARFLITIDDLDYLDCDLTLHFIKRNLYLNLFYYDQIDLFFSKCEPNELDF